MGPGVAAGNVRVSHSELTLHQLITSQFTDEPTLTPRRSPAGLTRLSVSTVTPEVTLWIRATVSVAPRSLYVSTDGVDGLTPTVRVRFRPRASNVNVASLAVPVGSIPVSLLPRSYDEPIVLTPSSTSVVRLPRARALKDLEGRLQP